MSERYSFSLTTFSPSGKLVQIEYALNAVNAGQPAVGIKAKDGVVIATEKKHKSTLQDETSYFKVEPICDHIGMVYAGMGPDYRVIVTETRKEAAVYKRKYGEDIPVEMLVQNVAGIFQNYTQQGGVRVFGISLLIIGMDKNGPMLYQCDPSGCYFPWKATALGKNYYNARSFLERRYNEDLELDDAVHTAILTLKESFEGQMNETNIEIGICDKEGGFRRLQPSEVRDYLGSLA